MFDPIGDFEFVADGLEPVTVSPRQSAAVAGVSALRRAITTKEAEKSNGKYNTNDSVFHVSTNAVATKAGPGSAITDAAGTLWTILETAKQTLSARWRYVARDLVLTHELTELVFHEVATFAKGPTGEQVPTFAPASPDTLAVRFQPLDSKRQSEYSATHFPDMFVGYFAAEFEVDSNHRFVAVDGTIYKPIKSYNSESIFGLFTVECEVIKWPQN